MPLKEWKKMTHPREVSFTIPDDWGNGAEGWHDILEAIQNAELGQGD